jgi:6-pyruvoyltetrahydropterin/6-carboxytetrahydropterin synthase
MEIFKEFRFESAHRLPKVPPEHKCSRLHGHSYRCEIHVQGREQKEAGWVIDFGDITAAFEPIRLRLDHYYLNEIEGLENPTSEILARWVWRQLRPALPHLSHVVIRETCTSGTIYQGEEEFGFVRDLP